MLHGARRAAWLALAFILLPIPLRAQPFVEPESQDYERLMEVDRLLQWHEYVLGADRIEHFVDSALPGQNVSTPLILLTRAQSEAEKSFPALETARTFLLLYPNDDRAGEVWYQRAVAAWQTGLRHEARTSFQEIVRNKGDRADESYYWLARMAAEEDSLDVAELLADKALEDPGHEFTDDAYYLSAWIKEGKGEYADAAQLYRQLIDETPDSDLGLDAQLRLGVNQAREGHFESALTLFSSLTPQTARQEEELLFFMAESNAALGEHDRAIENYTEFLRKHPTSPRQRSARYGLGWSQLQVRDFDQAILTFDMLTGGGDSLAAAALYQIGAINVVRNDTAAAMRALHELVYRLPYESFSDNAYNILGRIHYRRGNYDSARQYLRITARQFPESDVRTEAFHLLGESYAALRQYDNAQYSFSRVVKLGDSTDPEVRHALFREGVMLYHIGRFASGINRLRRFVSHYPDDPYIDEATFWLAESLYQDGTLDEAEHFFDEVLTNWPDSRYVQESAYGTAWAQFRQKKFRESAESFERYLDKYPDSPNAVEATIRLADSYRFLRQFDKAVAAYESVGGRAGSDRRSEEARVRLAEAFVEMGRVDRAVSTYRGLADDNTGTEREDDYAFAVGATWFRGGNDSLAIVELERFAREYPESEYLPKAYFLLGDSWYNLGEFETALVWYQKVLDEHPGSTTVPDALEGLRFALESMGRGPDAVDRIDRFVAANPDRLAPDSLTYDKGMIFFDNGLYDQADTLFRKLIDEYPESALLPNAWYQLGKGSEYSGDLDGAISLYDKVVKEYSTSDAALLALIDMAELRLFQEDYQTAGADFNLFIRRFSGSDRLNQARYGSGRAALALGDTADAKEQFRFVVDSVSPTDGADLYVDRSRLALAEILWAQGNPDDALEQLATVASRRRDYTAAEALLMRGKILIDVNDLSAALAELRRLTTEFEDYPEYVEDGLMALGGLYEKLTDRGAAIETYERLIEMTDDEDVKKKAEQRINDVRRGG